MQKTLEFKNNMPAKRFIRKKLQIPTLMNT